MSLLEEAPVDVPAGEDVKAPKVEESSTNTESKEESKEEPKEEEPAQTQEQPKIEEKAAEEEAKVEAPKAVESFGETGAAAAATKYECPFYNLKLETLESAVKREIEAEKEGKTVQTCQVNPPTSAAPKEELYNIEKTVGDLPMGEFTLGDTHLNGAVWLIINGASK